jgi:hypothetical protein
MSLDALFETIRNKRCYENANPTTPCPNVGVNHVRIINRTRQNGRLIQITETAWGCKEHS